MVPGRARKSRERGWWPPENSHEWLFHRLGRSSPVHFFTQVFAARHDTSRRSQPGMAGERLQASIPVEVFGHLEGTRRTGTETSRSQSQLQPPHPCSPRRTRMRHLRRAFAFARASTMAICQQLVPNTCEQIRHSPERAKANAPRLRPAGSARDKISPCEILEAGGVEPPSEKPCHPKPTCLSRSEGFAAGAQSGQDALAASPMISPPHCGPKRGGQPTV